MNFVSLNCMNVGIFTHLLGMLLQVYLLIYMLTFQFMLFSVCLGDKIAADAML